MRLMKSINNLGIRYKLLIGYASAFLIFFVIGGLIVYPIMHHAIRNNIENELNNTTKSILGMVKTATDVSIKNYLRAVAEKNLDIVEHFHESYQRGELSEEEAKQQASAILLSQRIGDTGYIYCLDSKGIIKVHPVIPLRGADLNNHEFIQEQLRKKEGYIEYNWKNIGEKEERPKALYMVYFKPWDWIISVSSYRQEFSRLIRVDSFRDSILSLRFGKTGYSFIMDSKGNLIVHPHQQGSNILAEKDADGRAFIQEMIRQKNGKIFYPWQNPGESISREKLVFFNYIPDLDWIVASSGYVDEFSKPLDDIKRILAAILIASLIFLLVLTYFYSSYIVKSLDKLIRGFNRGSAGDLKVRISKTSLDEFGKLSDYFNAFMEKLDAYSESLQQQMRDRISFENELREVNRIQSLILDNSVMGIAFLRNRIFEWINPRFPAMLGLSAEKVQGASARILYPSDQAYAEGEYGIYPTLAQGKWFETEFAILRPDGTTFIGRALGKAIDPSAPHEGSIWIFEDVTERKQAEETLRESEKRLLQIINFIPDATFAIDTEGKVIAWNRASEEMTGVKAKEMLGKGNHEYSLPFYGVKRPILIDLVFKSNEEISTKYLFVKRDGERLLAEAHVPLKGKTQTLWGAARPLYDSAGKIVGAIESIRDITELRQGEEALRMTQAALETKVEERTAELRTAKEIAEAANRSKSLFLANMSHELRTPLNAILGYSQLMLQDPSLNFKNIDYLHIINRSGEHLLALINDVLEIAKIEAGRTKLVLTPFDIRSMLDDLGAMFRIKAEAKGLRLDIEGASELPPQVIADENKLRQILINLLGNAVKFTERGSIALRVSAKDEGEGRMRLIAEAQDTGPGVAEDELDKVFESFEQTRSGKLSETGTGLGLFISRNFARLMGGDITLVSRLGEGSTFRLEANVGKGTTGSVVRQKDCERHVIALEPGQSAYRVLVVEDNEASGNLLVALLESAGFEVRKTANGLEAIEAFEQWRPHFIWMDRRMPVLDGIEATRRIRALPGGHDVRIAGVTASTFREQRPELLAAGMDAVVYKPYQLPEIFEAMTDLLGVRFVRTALGAESGAPAAAVPDTALGASELALLSEAVRHALSVAVRELDEESLNRALEPIQATQPQLVACVRAAAANFQYEMLWNWLEDESESRY